MYQKSKLFAICSERGYDLFEISFLDNELLSLTLFAATMRHQLYVATPDPSIVNFAQLQEAKGTEFSQMKVDR